MAPDSKQTIKQKLKPLYGNVIEKDFTAKFSKVGDLKYSDLRVLVYDPIAQKRELQEIKKRTDYFSKFKQREITHFYVEPKLAETK